MSIFTQNAQPHGSPQPLIVGLALLLFYSGGRVQERFAKRIDCDSTPFSAAKAPAKLATLLPLALNDRGLLSFQEIIRKAETGRGQNLMEMELKRIKGRAETRFEVVLADGNALLFDAATGKSLAGL